MRNLAKFLLLFPLTAGASLPKDWLIQPPASAGSWRDWSAIPTDSFFEVAASRLATAEAWLADKPLLALEQRSLEYFGHPSFKCSGSDKPYLIRAQYVNGGTGKFNLLWTQDGDLVISHASLGPGGPPTKSAIIACLARDPKAVFSLISGAL